MSTRIGKYIYEDNYEEMDVKKLQYLQEYCEQLIKEKHRKEIHSALTEINLLAHSYGFDICVEDSDGCITYLNEITLDIRDREE